MEKTKSILDAIRSELNKVNKKEIDWKKYTTYRCAYGHCYLVNLDTGKAKFLEDEEMNKK